jgi:nicotinamidase-related amidase
MAGSAGAEIIPELAAVPGDFILPKRTYSSFYETGLDALLRQSGVDTVVLTGQHTNMCVRHTAADAFFRGYRIVVPEDGVEAFSDDDQASGLAYLRQVYKAETPKLKDLL